MGSFVVIICLFVLGCVQISTSLYNDDRQSRQVPTMAPTAQMPPTESMTSNMNYNNTQFPYVYPSYSDYRSNVDQTKQFLPATNVPQPTAQSSSTNSTSFLEKFVSRSLLQRVNTYSIYMVQLLMVALLGTSLLNYICSHWSICDNIFGENNFWKTDKRGAKRFGRSYETLDYLDDISSTIFKAIDKYSDRLE